MRKGQTVICGDLNPTDSMQSEATRLGATLLQQGVDFSWVESTNNQEWSYVQGTADPIKYSKPALQGQFQLNNAAAAIALVKNFQNILQASDLQINQGLEQASVIGRLQKLADSPELIVDVAHNPQSATALGKYLADHPIKGKTIALFSALIDKDIEGIIAPVSSYFEEWHLVQLDGPRAYDNQQLGREVEALVKQKPLKYYTNFETALKSLKIELKSQDRVVAFGSFLVVSGVIQGINKSIID